MLEQFIYREMHTVMSIDALPTSHPISVPVSTPEEIGEIFDAISYNKGPYPARGKRWDLWDSASKIVTELALLVVGYSSPQKRDTLN